MACLRPHRRRDQHRALPGTAGTAALRNVDQTEVEVRADRLEVDTVVGTWLLVGTFPACVVEDVRRVRIE